MKVLIFILLFFFVVGLMFINNYNLHLSNEEELKDFSELYFNWFGQIYSNFFSVTGHFAKLDWLPK